MSYTRKYFRGTVEEFNAFMLGLDKSSAKYEELMNSVIYISEYIDDNLKQQIIDNNYDGAIFANGAIIAGNSAMIEKALQEIREHIEVVDSSINTLTEKIEEYMEKETSERVDADKELSDKIDATKEALDSSIKELGEKLTQEIADETTAREESDNILDERISKLEQNTVTNITTPNKDQFVKFTPELDHKVGEVVLDVETVYTDADDKVTFKATGLATDAYVEERIAWDDWDDENEIQ